MATYRLVGREGSVAEITDFLQIAPTRVGEIGDLISKRSPKPRYREEWIWLLESSTDHHPTREELADHLHRLLDILEPVADRLHQLESRGIWANWFSFVASSATEHAVELDRDLMNRLLLVPGELWLDVCGDDDDSATPGSGPALIT